MSASRQIPCKHNQHLYSKRHHRFQRKCCKDRHSKFTWALSIWIKKHAVQALYPACMEAMVTDNYDDLAACLDEENTATARS